MISEQILIENGMWIADEDERMAFLDRVTEWVEIRVGELLCRDMNDAQVEAFNRLCDGDMEEARATVALAGDDWRESEMYLTIKENTGEPDDSEQLLLDFATAYFLDCNCPDYTDLIIDAEREASSILGFRKTYSWSIDHPFSGDRLKA